jgi:hypothetical protein
MSIGFWFDTEEIDKQAEKELKDEHFRRMVDRRKAYLENKPWWRRVYEALR